MPTSTSCYCTQLTRNSDLELTRRGYEKQPIGSGPLARSTFSFGFWRRRLRGPTSSRPFFAKACATDGSRSHQSDLLNRSSSFPYFRPGCRPGPPPPPLRDSPAVEPYEYPRRPTANVPTRLPSSSSRPYSLCVQRAPFGQALTSLRVRYGPPRSSERPSGSHGATPTSPGIAPA